MGGDLPSCDWVPQSLGPALQCLSSCLSEIQSIQYILAPKTKPNTWVFPPAPYLVSVVTATPCRLARFTWKISSYGQISNLLVKVSPGGPCFHHQLHHLACFQSQWLYSNHQTSFCRDMTLESIQSIKNFPERLQHNQCMSSVWMFSNQDYGELDHGGWAE